jgi:hypothetical protein
VATVAIAVHDTTYLLDFCVKRVDLSQSQDALTDYVLSEIKGYEREHYSKFSGAGIPKDLTNKYPTLCSRLWAELDVLPIEIHKSTGDEKSYWSKKRVDEQADSMARKCIM